MSNETDIKETNAYVDQLEKSIADEYFNYYEYSNFKNTRPIGNGAFGRISRANWKDTDAIFALKSFNDHNLTLKMVVNEVLILVISN